MSFSASRLPAWAGEAHRDSKAKGKAKSKKKDQPSLPAGDGEQKTTRGGGASSRTKKADPELDKIVVQKNAILTTRKWQQNASQLAGEVSAVLSEAASVADSENFTDVILKRYEKFAAMAPKVELSPKRNVLKKDHDELRNELTPVSKGKTHQLEHPTKKGLEEYNKTMGSLESAVQKSIKVCTSHIEKVKIEEERERAKKRRIEQLKQKESERKAKAFKKAQSEGAQLADKELPEVNANQEDGSGSDDANEADDDGAWPLVSAAQEILGRVQSPVVRLGLS